jgi:hypothetical protein
MPRNKRLRPEDIFRKLTDGNRATQTYLAAAILDSAFQLAVQTQDAEGSSKNPEGIAGADATALASIVLSVAFLEGFLNELLYDTGNMLGGQIGSAWLGMPASKRVARLDDLGAFRGSHSVLQKYQLLLAMADRPAMPEDQEPFQAAKVLCQLRNALIHYEPEFIVHPEQGPPAAENHALSDALRGRFQPSPALPQGRPFFPDACFGSPAAFWACKTALAVPMKFFECLGFDDLDRHLDRLIPIRQKILQLS